MSANVDALRHELAALGPGTDQAEAGMVAETAVTYSGRLAEEYRVVPPARLHNLLIQVGIKDRGLCYHWTEDLMKRLQALDLRTYQLHWGVAHRGNDLREHNSVVITANGQPFEAGLLLDPWRNSGTFTGRSSTPTATRGRSCLRVNGEGFVNSPISALRFSALSLRRTRSTLTPLA